MQLWEDLKERRGQAIAEICSLQQAESQDLEFKQKSDVSNPILNKDDKRNLGRSLSGFSNATGGVLIWGVETGKSSDDESLAKSPKPIFSYDRFARNLSALIPEYLSPPNLSIEILPIESAANDGSGFVAIRVEASDKRPHMSLAPGHNTYFLRVGDVTHPMVDFQVRDMLRIQTAPVLKMGYLFEKTSISGAVHGAELILTVANESDISANHPYLLVLERGGAVGSSKAKLNFERIEPADRSTLCYHAINQCILHPGIELRAVAFLGIRFQKSNSGVYFRSDKEGNAVKSEIYIKAAVGCEHTRAREVELRIDSKEMELIAMRTVEDWGYLGKKRF
ncbi:MAG: ATP-binding protein [Kiloniellales bacterium]|nr:ATP-binding protein [Kiloniellales bacterium]